MRQVIIIISLVFLFTGLLTFENTRYRPIPVRSTLDNHTYQVRGDLSDPLESANILALVRQRVFTLIDYLDPDNNIYHRRLIERFPYTKFKENPAIKPEPTMTSYSLNKGEEIIMCLRNPINNQIYDIDILMYVAIHEISHIACPEVGHTPLFRRIFSNLLEIALKNNLIQKTDYRTFPAQYCGMTLSERVV